MPVRRIQKSKNAQTFFFFKSKTFFQCINSARSTQLKETNKAPQKSEDTSWSFVALSVPRGPVGDCCSTQSKSRTLVSGIQWRDVIMQKTLRDKFEKSLRSDRKIDVTDVQSACSVTKELTYLRKMQPSSVA